MKTIVMFLTLLLAAGLLACGKQQARHIVILPDVSGSIERQALEQAFKAIDEMAGHLQRGDRITVIPILGDAQAEASGRIIRFEVPANRQAYDSDLRNFRATLTKSLEAMKTDAAAHPGLKTDILGSLELAEQELRLSVAHSKLLVILSDFIQEDREIDFRSDNRLINQASVNEYAMRMTEVNHVDFKRISVYLGLLRSTEFADISSQRRNTIQKFWIQYFEFAGAHPRFMTDGPGLLESLENK